MRPVAYGLLLAFLWLAAPSAAQPGPGSVYGLELDVSADRERLLVFADRELEPRLEAVDAETLMLVLPGMALDPSAPERLTPAPGGRVVRATAFERLDGDRQEVRITVQHAPGRAPELSRRGSMLALDFAVDAAAAPAPPERLELGGLDLPALIRAVAAETGETFLHDDALRGTVNVVTPRGVSPAEARRLLDAALLLAGFAAVPGPGGAQKVVPLAGAPGPFRGELAPDAGDAPLATVVRLASADVETVVAAVRPLAGSASVVLGHPEGSALVLAGPGRRIQRLRHAIARLDAGELTDVAIWSVHHHDAETLAAQLREAFVGERLVVAADARTQRVAVRAPPDRLPELRAFVAALDRPPAGRGRLRVVPLRHADPETLAEELRGLRQGAASLRAGAVLAGREFAVAADRPTHALLIRADPGTATLLEDVIERLDREPARVRIDLTVAEVTTSEGLTLGFDFFAPVTSPRTARDPIGAVFANPSGNGLRARPDEEVSVLARWTRAPLALPITLANGDPFVVLIPRESFALTADARAVESRVLMKPQLLALNGEEHQLFAGNNVPVPVAQAEPGSPLTTRQDIQRQDVGLSLRVTPTLGVAGDVDLAVDLEVSRIDEPLAGAVERVGPTFRKRELSTSVHLEPERVALLAFAEEPRRVRTEAGTPFLRDLPWFGHLFRTRSTRREQTHLLVTVSARVEKAETLAVRRVLERALHTAPAQLARSLAAPRR